MISQDKLIKALKYDLAICQRANPADDKDKQRRILEYNTLLNHLMWAERVGSDQGELETIVQSLEANNVIRGYQRWRESSTR